MQDCKLIDAPMAKGKTLTRTLSPKTLEEKEQMSKIPYLSAVGSLMYAMMCTRPDISRYQCNLGQEHWKEIKRILRYLKGKTNYSLCYQGNDM